MNIGFKFRPEGGKPEGGTLRLAEDDNSEECAILCESGARPGVSWFAS